MVYRIKEAFWSWGNDFAITDAAGRPCFRVDGRAFSWGDKLSFQNAAGQELAFINQTLLSLKPRYRIERGGHMLAEVVKEFSWLRQKFTLDIPGPNDYTIEGSFWEHEFTFTRLSRRAARVSKSYWSWTDSYGVDIANDEDEILILCACIVIDQVLFDERKK